MATLYSNTATDQNNAKSNSALMKKMATQTRTAKGVITLTAETLQNDIHLIEEVKPGADIDWLGAIINSTNAALAGKIGTVNAAGTFTAKATLTAASNVGRGSAPENVAFGPTTATVWIAYQLTAASPATSGTAEIRVPFVHLSH